MLLFLGYFLLQKWQKSYFKNLEVSTQISSGEKNNILWDKSLISEPVYIKSQIVFVFFSFLLPPFMDHICLDHKISALKIWTYCSLSFQCVWHLQISCRKKVTLICQSSFPSLWLFWGPEANTCAQSLQDLLMLLQCSGSLPQQLLFSDRSLKQKIMLV